MTPPEVVVFDLGKVLLDFDYRIAARALAQNGTCDAETIVRTLLGTPLLLRYECGYLTSSEFYREFCSSTSHHGSEAVFANAFGPIFTPIEPMIRLHQELRSAGWPTFVFSNTNELAIRHIRQAYPFFTGFTGYILSYEHGWMKPDPRLYEVVEHMSGRKGEAILYLDDRPENVETGRDRGWQCILHVSPEMTIPAVRAALGLNRHASS